MPVQYEISDESYPMYGTDTTDITFNPTHVIDRGSVISRGQTRPIWRDKRGEIISREGYNGELLVDAKKGIVHKKAPILKVPELLSELGAAIGITILLDDDVRERFTLLLPARVYQDAFNKINNAEHDSNSRLDERALAYTGVAIPFVQCKGVDLQDWLDPHSGTGRDVNIAKYMNAREVWHTVAEAIVTVMYQLNRDSKSPRFVIKKPYLHCDLKPSNLMLCETPGQAFSLTARVIDFGEDKCHNAYTADNPYNPYNPNFFTRLSGKLGQQSIALIEESLNGHRSNKANPDQDLFATAIILLQIHERIAPDDQTEKRMEFIKLLLEPRVSNGRRLMLMQRQVKTRYKSQRQVVDATTSVWTTLYNAFVGLFPINEPRGDGARGDGARQQRGHGLDGLQQLPAVSDDTEHIGGAKRKKTVWQATARTTVCRDGKSRMLYKNSGRPGELRVRRMVARNGTTVATYVKP
jgi:hypothetical protein